MGTRSTGEKSLTIQHLFQISRQVTQTLEWKPALDEIVSICRSVFIFDNLVVYLVAPPKDTIEVVYARAAGRGRSAEADMSWGESVATAIVHSHEPVIQEPPADQAQDRMQRPYIAGIPLSSGKKILGAFILIRFGGPRFLSHEIDLAHFIAQQISLLIERQNLQDEFHHLEEQQQQYRLQDDFVSTITHELRNPLGFIKGYTTTLLRSDTQWDQTIQQEFLTIIDQETDRLQELIDNLLDSARLQSGQMPLQFQVVRLDTVLNDVIMRARMHHPTLNIQLVIEKTNLAVHGDPRRLAQVFENIVGNSLKYAPGSPILITIKPAESGVNLLFHDDGPGIPESYLPFVFNRFFRSPDTPQIHGSGLGLYICKQIILAHNGHIQAVSQTGQGTTFTIFLPFSA